MTSGTKEVIFRQAEERDCDEICRLVKEHAEYEKMPDQFKLTPDIMRRDGFGEERLFHCIIAEEKPGSDGLSKGVIVGYVMYYFVFSSWEGRVLYIEDIFVIASKRGQGIGSRFWKELAQIAVKRDCVRFQFVVHNKNLPSIKFYKSRGAVDLTATDEWHLYKVNRPEIERVAN